MHGSVKTDKGEIGFISNFSGSAKEVVVLLHGIGASADFFRPLIELAEDRKFLAWEAPGFGTSSPLSISASDTPSPDAQSPDTQSYAAALALLFTELDLPYIHLVGHSWGALIAAEYARLYPDRLQSLALVNPPPGYGGLPSEERDRIIEGRLAKLAELGPQGVASLMAPALLAPSANAELIETTANLGAGLQAHGVAQATYMMGDAHILQSLSGATLPLLVITGADDKITPPALGEEIRNFLPHAELVRLADCGHLAPLEKPQETYTALSAFWSSVASRERFADNGI